MGYWSGPQGTRPPLTPEQVQEQQEYLAHWERLAREQQEQFLGNVALVQAVRDIEDQLIALGEEDWLRAR